MEFVNTLIKNLPTFGEALLKTLELAAVAILLALILGIIFGLFTVSGFKILEILSAIYCDIEITVLANCHIHRRYESCLTHFGDRRQRIIG